MALINTRSILCSTIYNLNACTCNPPPHPPPPTHTHKHTQISPSKTKGGQTRKLKKNGESSIGMHCYAALQVKTHLLDRQGNKNFLNLIED